jgi:HSP20 family protein
MNSFDGYWSPAVDIYETGRGMVIFVELPGMTMEDVEVLARQRSVLVRGFRRPPLAGMAPMWLEIRTGRFERELDLPFRIGMDGVTAAMADGVLRIEVPRAGGASSRIPVRGPREGSA